MNNLTAQGEKMNTKEETIFKCADGLFRMSQEIHSINPDISNALLFLSDRLLKEVEITEKTVEDKSPAIQKVFNLHPKEKQSHVENCPDCGGIKVETKCSDDKCPDCGGIKPQALNISTQIIIDEKDPGSRCNGHSSDGTGVTQPSNETKAQHSPKIRNEIETLIEEIRKGL